jgi:hypothetical protein
MFCAVLCILASIAAQAIFVFSGASEYSFGSAFCLHRDLLFQIDPVPYRLTVAQTEADHRRAQPRAERRVGVAGNLGIGQRTTIRMELGTRERIGFLP